jgi:hypothetical protein
MAEELSSRLATVLVRNLSGCEDGWARGPPGRRSLFDYTDDMREAPDISRLAAHNVVLLQMVRGCADFLSRGRGTQPVVSDALQKWCELRGLPVDTRSAGMEAYKFRTMVAHLLKVSRWRSHNGFEGADAVFQAASILRKAASDRASKAKSSRSAQSASASTAQGRSSRRILRATAWIPSTRGLGRLLQGRRLRGRDLSWSNPPRTVRGQQRMGNLRGHHRFWQRARKFVQRKRWRACSRQRVRPSVPPQPHLQECRFHLRQAADRVRRPTRPEPGSHHWKVW